MEAEEQQWQDFIIDSYSDRSEVLSSHHFVFFTHVRIDQPRHKLPRSNYSACRDPDIAFAFANEVNHWMNQLNFNSKIDYNHVSSLNDCLIDSMKHAAQAILPHRKHVRHRPWISDLALSLIDQRSLSRIANDIALERHLNRQIKIQVKSDRVAFLDRLLASGYWSAVRALRKKLKSNAIVLRDLKGDIVSSNAKSLGEYFESVQ